VFCTSSYETTTDFFFFLFGFVVVLYVLIVLNSFRGGLSDGSFGVQKWLKIRKKML